MEGWRDGGMERRGGRGKAKEWGGDGGRGARGE